MHLWFGLALVLVCPILPCTQLINLPSKLLYEFVQAQKDWRHKLRQFATFLFIFWRNKLLTPTGDHYVALLLQDKLPILPCSTYICSILYMQHIANTPVQLHTHCTSVALQVAQLIITGNVGKYPRLQTSLIHEH